MKRVVNKSMVAHLFAAQSQDHATTAMRNFYFYGTKCNSYGSHFTAAVHHGDTVLINANRYSVTTASQLSELRHACSHLQTFTVRNPDADTKEEHRENFRVMVSDYENEIFRASRARIYNSLDSANSMLVNANAYAARFKIGNRLQSADLAATLERIATRNARQTAAEKRAAKVRAKRDAERLAVQAEKQAENLVKWYAGELSCYDLPLRHSQPVALRLTSDGETVQTSQGAEFPTEHARKGMAFVLACFDKGRDFASNGHNIRLGHFQVSRIDADAGLLLAGCHTVTRSEIEHLAALIAA